MNMNPHPDRRNATVRDAEMLSRVERDGGFSVSFVCANRDHAASLHRLIASRRIRIEGSGWIPVVQESPRSVWDGLREWAREWKLRWLGGDAV